MALAHLHWFSQTLKKQVAMNVILPDGGKPPFATFYLLHGLSDDYSIWLRRTRIESYAEKYPLIIVMPDGFRGFYTDNNTGPAYATYIAEELPAFVERNFPAKATRAGRCIGGLSMGGYGALRLALAHPDRYVSAVSHSGALAHGSLTHPRSASTSFDPSEFQRVFGRNPRGSRHDLMHLATLAKRSRKPLPALRIDCGSDDFLIDANRGFHRFLSDRKIPHEYEEFPGSHTWDYWDLHIQESLAFHARHLKLPG